MANQDMDKIIQDINSLPSSGSNRPQKRTELQERVIEKAWQILTEIYGSSLVTQYGTKMPEAWITLLKGVTPRNISDGLNALSGRGSTFPPNGGEFRNLCLGIQVDKDGNDISHQHKGKAHIEFKDPAHPDYKPKQLASDEQKKKTRSARDKAMGDMGL